MRLITLLWLPAIAGAAFIAAPAAALIPIDDFEIGSFSLQNPGDTCVTYTDYVGGSPGHIITPERTMMLCANGPGVTAQLSAGTQVDDAILLSADQNDHLTLIYDWDFPLDLTSGGFMNRIEVDLKQAVSGTVSIGIRNSGWGVSWHDIGTPGVVSFLFSEFPAIDVTTAKGLYVRVYSTAPEGIFEIADIRLRGGYWGTGETADFHGDFVATEVPPIPSPPLSFRLTDAGGNWLYRTNVTITGADAGVIEPCFHADWTEAAAMGGEIGGIIFAGINPQPFMDTDFELAVDLEEAIRRGPLPEVVGTPILTAGAFGFLITFPVRLTDVAGNEIGRSETRVLFDVRQGQPLRMENVQVIPRLRGPAVNEGFDISFSLLETGDVDEAVPLFDATWIADWSTPNTSAAGEAAPALDAMVLTAWPGVTRGGTELRASLPFAGDAPIEIHDVSGRLVRTLTAQSGAASVRWDGRDSRGVPTASGFFLARLAGGESEPARIFRLR